MFTKKKVLLIGSLLATLALGLASAPSRSASARKVWIYPTGNAQNDTHALLDAIVNASPGDTVMLGAGEWIIGIPNYSGNYAVYSGGPNPIDVRSFYFQGNNNREQILIDKDLIIKGEVGTDGVPTTVLKESEWILDYNTDDHWTSFINHHGAKVRFENLKFEKWALPFVPMAPFEFVNLHADTVIVFAWPLVDVRTIYPSYASTGSYVKPRATLIKDCVIENYGSVHHLHGVCEATLEGNLWGRVDPDIRSAGMSYWGWPILIDAIDISWILYNLDGTPCTPYDIDTRICRNVTVQNNIFVNWNETKGDGGRAYGGLCLGQNNPALRPENILVKGNTFEKFSDGWFSFLARFTDDVEIINNTIKNFVGNPWYANMCSWDSDNTIIGNNTFDTISNSYGALEVWGGNYNRLISSEYQQSGFLGWNGDIGCVILYSGGGHFVSEHLFPAGTNMCDQILDLGTDNRIPGYKGVCVVAEQVRAISEARRQEREQMKLESEGRKR